jgi:hypothetical protein
MPKKHFLGKLGMMLTLLAFIFACGQVNAGEFTGDLIINIPGQVDTLKLFVKDHWYFLEKLEGDNKIMLFRKSGKTTVMNPEEKQFKILKGQEENFINPVAAWENMSNDMEAKAGGDETVNGYECKKYLYNYPGQTEVAFERWLSQKLTFVIKQKILSPGGDATMELINIKEETVDDALFEIPSGYTPLLDPEDQPVPIPDWATDIESKPVMKPPFEKAMAAGEIVLVRVEAGKSVWVRGKSTTDGEAKAKAIPFKDGRPLKELSMYNNFASKGTICTRRHETTREADYVVIHVDEGKVDVEAKLADMYEKSVKAGRQFGMSLNVSDNIEVRFVNAIDGESTVKWDYMKEGVLKELPYAKYRTKTFEKENEFHKTTLSPEGDQIVFKVEKGEVLIKLGQFDNFKF